MSYDRFQKMIGIQSSPFRFLFAILKWPIWRLIWNQFGVIYGMDYRSLAFFRAFLGFIVIGDTLDRARNGFIHYADDGIWPRREVLTHLDEPEWFNVYMVGGSHLFVTIILFFHCVVALSYALGFYTKTSNFLCWLFVCSILGRNQLVGHGGDTLLRCLLFWSIFFPMGKVWSIDSILRQHNKMKAHYNQQLNLLQSENDNKNDYYSSLDSVGDYYFDDSERKRKNNNKEWWRYVSLTNVCLMIQVAYVYVFSFYLKTDKAWTSEYNASFLAISLDYFRMPLGDFFLQFPTILKLLTWAVALWELYGPLCYFLPTYQPHLRAFGILGFVGLHIGFGTTLRLGTFFWVGVSAHLIFFPTEYWTVIWDYLKSVFRGSDEGGITIFFPSKCSVCSWTAQVMSTFFFLPNQLIKPSYQAKKNHNLEDQESDPHHDHDHDHDHDHNHDHDHDHDSDHHEVESDQPVLRIKAKRRSPNNTSPTLESDNPELWFVEYSSQRYYGYKGFLLMVEWSPLLRPFHWLLRKRLFSIIFQYLYSKWLHPTHNQSNVYYYFNYFLYIKSKNRKNVPDENVQHENVPDEDVQSHLHERTSYKNVNDNQFYHSYFKAQKVSKERKRILKGVLKIIIGLIAVALIIYITSWNFLTVGNHNYSGLARNNQRFGIALHLHQSWSMFAPKPPSINWWYVYESKLRNGTWVDFFRNRGIYTWKASPLAWDKPNINKCIGNHRWWKYFEAYNDHPVREAIRLQYGRYLCRNWNANNERDQHLVTFKVWWMSEWNHEDGSHTFHNKILLWEHVC